LFTCFIFLFLKTYHILLGGNLGDRHANFNLAKQLIIKDLGEIVAESRLYETAAWGARNQPDFLNQAFAVSSALAAEVFLSGCLAIEDRLGRVRTERWGARTMDIDVLLVEDEIWDLPQLQVPHPRLHLRRFALLPLCDIAADAIHPIYSRKISEILAICGDKTAVFQSVV
jgi:2-amino-4-hydroxy-6-hydroxymethyldihydropteridine diphosphokinase